MILPQDFYKEDTKIVAHHLLGKLLVHETSQGTLAGKIVETEAYLYPNDPASHSFRGMTKRNEAMFGPAGHTYIYFTYGMHHCLNIVTGAKGEAVLIRALEPMIGVELMKQNRRMTKIKTLCNGPSKLMQSLVLDKSHNQVDLTKVPLYIMDQPSLDESQIGTSFRIGISKGKDLPLRYFIRDNDFVSVR